MLSSIRRFENFAGKMMLKIVLFRRLEILFGRLFVWGKRLPTFYLL